MEDTTEETPPDAVDLMFDLASLINRVMAARPNDKSSKDQAFAIAIVDLEKVLAWWRMFCIDDDMTDEEKIASA